MINSWAFMDKDQCVQENFDRLIREQARYVENAAGFVDGINRAVKSTGAHNISMADTPTRLLGIDNQGNIFYGHTGCPSFYGAKPADEIRVLLEARKNRSETPQEGESRTRKLGRVEQLRETTELLETLDIMTGKSREHL